MTRFWQGLSALLLALYPFWVSYSLAYGKWYAVAVALIALGVVRLLLGGAGLLWPLSLFAFLCAGLSLLQQEPLWLKLYPVAMSLGALAIFAATLWRPPSMIERFARLWQPELPASGVVWTRRVTGCWCVFFLLNALVAAWTVFFGSQQSWVLYNGFISYLLMGVLLAGEYLLRQRHLRTL